MVTPRNTHPLNLDTPIKLTNVSHLTLPLSRNQQKECLINFSKNILGGWFTKDRYLNPKYFPPVCW
jgi:hypothetical protein